MVHDHLEMTIARWHFSSYYTRKNEKIQKSFALEQQSSYPTIFCVQKHVWLQQYNKILSVKRNEDAYLKKGTNWVTTKLNLYLYLYIKIVDRVVFDLIPVSSYTDSFGNVTRWSLLNHWFNKNTHVLFVQFPWSRLFPMNWQSPYNAILANQCRLIK